jgi:FG-GAP-like repeat/Secretion system C-terminal sorting domain
MRIWIIVIVVVLLPCVVSAQTDWVEHTVDGEFDGAMSVYAADVDGDGDIDVLGAAEQDGDITWWENADGSGLNLVEHTVDGDFGNAMSVYATDVDGDGDMDVLGAGGSDGVAWWENVDGSGLIWSEHTVDSEFSGARCVYATDVDGDGDIDVLGAGGTTPGEFTWWENVSGDGLEWLEHNIADEIETPISVYAVDVDGDGDCDVLGASMWSDTISWWENVDGIGLNWARHLVGGRFHYAHSVFATDVDGDGDCDVLGASRALDDIRWWENVEGSGLNWAEHTVDEQFNRAHCVYALDMDGDGDTDVFGAAFDGNDIMWWENLDGAGLNWSEHLVDGEFDGAYSVYAADVNGDGNTDILGAANIADDITWWEQAQLFLTIELDPIDAPIVIPGQGGNFEFEVRISNSSGEIEWFSAWTEAILPNGNLHSPILRHDLVGIGPYGEIVTVVTQGVPGFAPTGEYQYLARVGTFPSHTMALDSFDFTKTSEISGSSFAIHEWTTTGLNFDLTEVGRSCLLAEYTSQVVHPNPFNPSTQISLTLPSASLLEVTVYNISGQRVATLANGQFCAGSHSFTFDGSLLSSGIYFVHTVVQGKLSSMQKLVLVK